MKIKNDPSGIDFNFGTTQLSWEIPVRSDGRNKIGQNYLEYSDQFGITPILNAVEIDWNGAELKNNSEIKATLNTTGESLVQSKKFYIISPL
ncbi:MAG: hypothetical protein J6S02_02000 [Bacteroidaceae bacterium]|nr:hypothetical protein [Bacteroidaceae bacterium]